ncbi:MAG: PQQ-binding-like beta-propeller repeat protein [Verrucomicrobia bacterium]|nr:PQQ-binding-like beta-propeller repeat protein [Verrucomicrobiota bacterium]
MKFSTYIVVVLAFHCLVPSALQAANWPQWRGPFSNGSTDEVGLPSTWSKSEGVKWSLDMSGPSASTAIVWDDSVFISTADTSTKTLQAICVDRQTGKLRWQKQTGVGIERDDRSNFSSPSPVTDGERVIFFYGNGQLVAMDFGGNEIWSRNIQKDYGEFAFQWTFSSSPLLYDGKLYLQVLQRDVAVNGRGNRDGSNDSYFLAIDPVTGKTLWRQIRPSQAVAESRESFTTPVVFEHGGRTELLVIGGDDLTGFDPITGKELWRWGTWNPNRIGHWRLVPSAVGGDGIILACAPKRDPIYAIKAGGDGLLTDSAIAWKSGNQSVLSSDVPTPLFYEGDFLILSDVRGSLSRVEPKTGKIEWTTEMPGRKKYEASPTGADGKVYCMNFGGDVVVVNAGDGKIVHQTAMGEPGDDFTRSSIAVSHGQLFIRTNSKLFCVAKD